MNGVMNNERMHPRLRGCLLPIAAALCLWIAGMRHAPLLGLRAAYGLNAGDPLENAPPLMVFTTVVLGGFRGMIADVLWLRASWLQENGMYLELVQLADWITKLEPRASEVWAFHAWNMAYNVSVMMPDPEDRWRWVKNGIHLLRDEGIRYNPSDSRLYWELGWIYLHKIGGDADRAHAFYKKQWGVEMARFLNGPTPDYDKLALTPDTVGHILREEYKLIPEIMRDVDAKHGPLDWRLPEAHAIYWAYRGLEYADEQGRKACERMIRHSLDALDKKK